MSGKTQRPIYAGWSHAEAIKAGDKTRLPYRLIQLRLGEEFFSIVMPAGISVAMKGRTQVTVEERIEIPLPDGRRVDVYLP